MAVARPATSAEDALQHPGGPARGAEVIAVITEGDAETPRSPTTCSRSRDAGAPFPGRRDRRCSSLPVTWPAAGRDVDEPRNLAKCVTVE